MSDDSESMDCAPFVEAISAIVDGERPGVDPHLVDAHVDRCPDCAEYRRVAERTRRGMRILAAEPETDVAHTIRSKVSIADRAGALKIPLVLLFVVAVEVIVVSAIDLFSASGDPAAIHSTRHLSAFTLAYGVLLLLVVARPARARTALPVAGVLAGALVITAIADLVVGRIPLVGEALHLPEVVSVVLIWLLAVPVERRPRRRRLEHDDPSSDPLRLVPVEHDPH